MAYQTSEQRALRTELRAYGEVIETFGHVKRRLGQWVKRNPKDKDERDLQGEARELLQRLPSAVRIVKSCVQTQTEDNTAVRTHLKKIRQKYAHKMRRDTYDWARENLAGHYKAVRTAKRLCASLSVPRLPASRFLHRAHLLTEHSNEIWHGSVPVLRPGG